MADRVGVMRSGHLEQVATPADVYDRPATAFVAQFVGAMNHLPGSLVDAGHVRVADQVLQLVEQGSATTGPVDVLVRPEAVGVEPDADGPYGVLVATFRGPTTRLLLRDAHGSELTADVASHRAASLSPGERVRIALPQAPVLVTPAPVPAPAPVG